MELASILIVAGIVCLVAGLSLPLVYGLRTWVRNRAEAPRSRARLVGATGVMGSR
jgi:hypothetical protein